MSLLAFPFTCRCIPVATMTGMMDYDGFSGYPSTRVCAHARVSD